MNQSSDAKDKSVGAANDRRGFLRAATGVSAGLVAGASVSKASENLVVPTPKKAMSGLLLPYAEGDTELGKEFLDKPMEFLEKHNLSLEDITCPPEVHEALHRSDAIRKKLSERIEDGSITEPLQLVKAAKDLVREEYGEDYRASFQPFGMRFQQKPPINTTITITGTVTITFLDSDADADG